MHRDPCHEEPDSVRSISACWGWVVAGAYSRCNLGGGLSAPLGRYGVCSASVERDANCSSHGDGTKPCDPRGHQRWASRGRVCSGAHGRHSAGLALGYVFPLAYSVGEPLLRLLSQVNPFSLMPAVFLMLFGSGRARKGVRHSVDRYVANRIFTVTAVRGVEFRDFIRLARAIGASRWKSRAKSCCLLRHPRYLPGCGLRPHWCSSCRGAEMLGGSGGLGWLVHNSAMNYQIPGIYAGALFVIVLGYVVQVLLAAAHRRLLARDSGWRGSSRSALSMWANGMPAR